MSTPRAQELGWVLPPFFDSGPHNTLTDVPGVLVGHVTLVQGQAGALQVGRGPVRTGVTAIRPHPGNLFCQPVPAGIHVLNGFGKTTGLAQLSELGRLETPILLTNTLSVWQAAEALLDWMLPQNPQIGITQPTLNPVVGECNDGWLNDIQGRHVEQQHIFAALEQASSAPISEGNVGAGTGTLCYQFKGGIGTASRVLPASQGRFTLGVLVQTNFGSRQQLVIRGQAVGRRLKDWPDERSSVLPAGEAGSCMLVIATDAPLSSRQLGRLARRAPLGLARSGFTSNSGSGDYAVAFSTHQYEDPPHSSTHPVERLTSEDPILSALFQATVEAVEESVYNALLAAETMAGRDGHIAFAIPRDIL